jgi:predicted transposase/invertase (TIGR01784 family)
MQLANLDNEVFFKKVFTDPEVFRAFVRDIAGVDLPNARIETEKELERKVAAIRFKLDIYAESADHRILVEIQRVDYDYNFDRFMHYFLAALIDLQRSSKDYAFGQEVYTIVVITAPYVVREKSGRILRDGVLISDLNPRTLEDRVRDIYPHKLIFLNPNHIGPGTPEGFADWLQLIHQSIENPKDPQINFANPGIKKAADLADVENMTGEVLEEAKKSEAGRKAAIVYEREARIAREEARTARESGRDEGRKEGRKEGRDEGRKEGRDEGLEEGLIKKETEAVIGFYNIGVSPGDIARALNIEIEKVEAIIRNMVS